MGKGAVYLLWQKVHVYLSWENELFVMGKDKCVSLMGKGTAYMGKCKCICHEKMDSICMGKG